MLIYSIIIVVSYLVFLLIVRSMNYPYGGTDHAYHYRLAHYIKSNHHYLVKKFPYWIPFSVCPQGYHWVCSFLNRRYLLQKANVINYVIFALTLLAFNGFIILIDDFSVLEIVLIDGVFVTLPIMYVVWNAKFMGLSARAFGIFLVYLYLFCFYFYFVDGTLVAFLLLLFFSFLCLLSSQFAFQFVCFSSIFFFVVTFDFKVLLIIPLDIALLFVLNFQYAKNFFYSQFHHKRNYFKFMIKDCQFKSRYSIWRDFIYDFWVKKDKSYILSNPVIEILIGALPNCLVLVYFPFSEVINDNKAQILYILLSASFFAFFVTSFRIGRFLGEPQRYIEFGIPFASILGVLVFPSWWVIVFIILNVFVLCWYIKNSQYHRQLPEHIKIREELIDYVQGIFNYEYSHLLSNDNEIARHFYVSNYEPHVPNHCKYYKDREEFLLSYYKGDYHRISPQFLASEMKRCQKGILILYVNLLKFYDESEILPLLDGIKMEHLRDIGKFKVFRFYNQKEF